MNNATHKERPKRNSYPEWLPSLEYLVSNTFFYNVQAIGTPNGGIIYPIVTALPNNVENYIISVSKTQYPIEYTIPIKITPNTDFDFIVTEVEVECGLAAIDDNDIIRYIARIDYERLFPNTKRVLEQKKLPEESKLGEATINALAKFSDIDDLKYYEITDEDIKRGYIWLPITKEKLNTHTNIHSFQEVDKDFGGISLKELSKNFDQYRDSIVSNEIGKDLSKPQTLEEAAKSTAKAMANIKENFGTKIKPSYYGPEGIQPKDYVRVHELSGNMLNVIKYVTRAGKKDKTKHLEDLNKARKYLDDEIDEVVNGRGISWWNKTWARVKKK